MRRFILILFAFCSSSLAFSQYSDFPLGNGDLSKINLDQLRFGFKLSPAISWINVQHNNAFAGGATMKLGVGLTANYEINQYLSVVSGVNYNSIGGYMADSASLADTNSKDYFKVNYNVVEIPLGLKINTSEINKYNYYLQGGFTSGFLISANEKHYKSADGKLLKTVDLMKDLTSPTAVGYFVGIGTGYKVSDKLKLFFEVNYKNVLTSVTNGENYVTDPVHSYSEAISILPANMEFSLGVEF